MEQIELEVTDRDVLGKKVRFLRRNGITPVHLFGHDVKSLALQCDTAQLQHVLAQAGQTRIIDLHLEQGKRPRSVMVREIQKNPITGNLLHVDLYQVRTTEKIRVEVPIVLVGEAPALKSRENMLTHDLNSLTIECLPTQMPDSIEVDLSSLTEADQAIRVKDITLGEEVTVLNEPELVLVKISVRRIEVEEVPEEVAVEEEVEVPEAAEGAAPPPEGEAGESKGE